VDERIIAVPLGAEMLALTQREFDAARARAAELGLSPKASGADAERLVDAEQLSAILQLPRSWIEEAARQSRIPSITAGRYRRFRPSAVIAALSTEGPHDHDQTKRGATTRRR
jgi:hypothetical protein